MDSKRYRVRKRLGTYLTPFPPSPAHPMEVPRPPSRHLMPVVAGIMGSLGLITLLILTVPWPVNRVNFTASWHALYNQVKQIPLPRTSKLTVEGSAENALPVEESPPPQISQPDSRFLIGRYPVRRYTNIRHRLRATDYLLVLIRQYHDQIFPKKYRDYRTLARYNHIPPPNYILVTGDVFLIPTAEHIVAPKTGYETEQHQLQTELTSHPTDTELLNRLAVIHFKRNELEQAATSLQRAINLSPEAGVLYNNLGFIDLIREADAKARTELEFAIAHTEKPAIPHCNLGTLYLTTGKPDLAIQAFEKALAIDANLLDAIYNLALACEQMGDRERAETYLHELARRLPADAEVKSALERVNSENRPTHR